MSRPVRVFLILGASIMAAALVAACGTERITVPKKPAGIYHGAYLFSQRCSGCHTLSYAATHGSASNVSTAQPNNGPNFDVRCERPVARVLYAIENGGFSGAIMPQNVVVGQDARDVAEFVAKYSGTKAPSVVGIIKCSNQPIGPLPEPASATSTAPGSTTVPAATPATP
jgi:mono/diheme cytochrome c family protein